MFRIVVRFAVVWATLMTVGMGYAFGAPPWNGDSSGISTQISGEISIYKVRPGDSLTLISSRFGASLNRLMDENELQPSSVIHPGQILHVDSRHIVPPVGGDGIVINVPEGMLFLFHDGKPVRSYPVGLGRPTWPTPIGNFKVMDKETDPVWDVPISIQEEMRAEGKTVLRRVPPGPTNPLGKYFVRIGPALGIHGTIAPASVYRFQTHGCIRLHPDDVADLFQQVTVGTPVRILYQPVLLAQVDANIYLEAHKDIYQRAPEVADWLRQAAMDAGVSSSIDWNLAADVLTRRDGVPVNVSRFGFVSSRTEKDDFYAAYQQSGRRSEAIEPPPVSVTLDLCGGCDDRCSGGDGGGNP